MPPLVIVSGAPAAGKTTLARRLAAELRQPLIAKDSVKELLGDALGAPDREASKRLGAATYSLLYAIAGWLLDAGVGMVLESNFWRGASEPQFAPLVARSRAVLVHCMAAPAVLERRYRERGERGERHPVHYDAEELPGLREAIVSGRFEPLALDVPVLVVDTADGYRPDFGAIVAFARGHAADA
jgi:predicted kinase